MCGSADNTGKAQLLPNNTRLNFNMYLKSDTSGKGHALPLAVLNSLSLSLALCFWLFLWFAKNREQRGVEGGWVEVHQ